MSYCFCPTTRKQAPTLPPMVQKLRASSRFKAFGEEDLASFYMEFRAITKGKENLNQREFFELIQCFNVL